MDRYMKPEATSSICGALSWAPGFTLFEVLVALAIMAIVFTSVFRMHGQTISMTGSARFYTLAPMLCQKKISDIEGEHLAETMDETGDFGEAYPGYGWHVVTEKVECNALDDNYPLTLVRIDVTVFLGEEGLSHHIRTYRYVEEE